MSKSNCDLCGISPQCAPQLYPEHDLFIQLMRLKNTLRWLMGENLITHLGEEYYD
jgi:myo-inositol-1-phosphate synthase